MLLSKSQHRILNKAIEIADKSDMLHCHGCVLARNSKIVQTGVNHYRSVINGVPVTSCHAEIHAILKQLKSQRVFSMASSKKGARQYELQGFS